MSRLMQRILMVILTMIALSSFSAISTAAENSAAPSRVINVVYDDSGSMIRTGGESVDTWCQAKYAMEVFAAMLGENDTMNIYYMSDFDYSTTAGPKLILYGYDPQQTNISKIHSTVSQAGNTPFNAVRKAYADLQKEQADEKWLVVLTDGEFEDGRLSRTEVDAFFAAKDSDILVMYLGMGENAGEITENLQSSIFFEKAETNSQILQKITDICTRIFNSDRLEVNVSAKTIEFDVPMAELMIFAQGANVSIGGIQDASGKEYLSVSEPVAVQYSETAATNYSSFTVARNLKGSIATFKDDFAEGKYTLEVSGADTIEVYYKPNVEVAAYLMDAFGAEVTAKSNLKRGEYIIRFGLVKAGTEQKVSDSRLLGTVEYSAEIVNNGKTYGAVSGDHISIDEGSLDIDAFAHFLEYNYVATHLSYSVFDDKVIGFVTLDSPSYTVSNSGADFSAPITVEMQVDGGITLEQWVEMTAPKVSFEAEEEAGYGPFRVEKSMVPGTFLIFPVLEGEPSIYHRYEDIEVQIDFDGTVDEARWNGRTSLPVHISDVRTRVSDLSFVSSPEYKVTANGLTVTEPLIIKAEFTGEPVTPEYWEQMVLLDADFPDSESRAFYGDFTVEKGSEYGTFLLYPSLKPGLMNYEIYPDFRFSAVYSGGNGTIPCDKTLEGTVRVNDTRSWLQRHVQLLIRIGIILAIVLLVLGYIPPFKKYLPRRLKRRPIISCTANIHGVHDVQASGKYRKNMATTFIPYKAETGTIKFVPPGAPPVPVLRVKAAGGSSMWITNTKAYAGREDVSFNGIHIEEGQHRPIRISAAAMLSVDSKAMTYTCIPNQ